MSSQFTFTPQPLHCRLSPSRKNTTSLFNYLRKKPLHQEFEHIIFHWAYCGDQNVHCNVICVWGEEKDRWKNQAMNWNLSDGHYSVATTMLFYVDDIFLLFWLFILFPFLMFFKYYWISKHHSTEMKQYCCALQ